VACEDEQWGCRTIGVSHCFAGLESGFSTPAELMQVYLSYFGSGPGPTPTVPYATETPTRTPTETVTFTPTLTRSVTVTPLTATRTMTITRTPSVTATKTLTIVTETPTPSYTPTAGWTVTYTPTGGGTETYTPTATPAVIQIGLFMPAETFGTGDTCWLNLSIDNPGAAQEVDLYVLLDVYSNYWCYPSWAPLTAGLDWSPMTVTEGMSDVLELIPQFTMPQVSPAGPLYFYAAMFERDHLDLEHLVSTGAVATFYLE
jgi:hypothetical protein